MVRESVKLTHSPQIGPACAPCMPRAGDACKMVTGPAQQAKSAGRRPGYRWHTGQKKVERPPCTIRLIAPLQPGVGHGRPARS